MIIDSVAELLGIQDLREIQPFRTGASEAARIALPDGSTIFAKRPFERDVADREIAALRFLGGIESPIPLGPKLLAVDPNSTLFLMEDLGEGEPPDTNSLLKGDDPKAALDGLIEHARLLATLHGLTSGRFDEFAPLRGPVQSAPPFDEPWPEYSGEPASEDELVKGAERYEAVLAGIGVSAPHGLRDEIVALGQSAEGVPTQNWCLCRGDQNMAGDYMRFNGVPRLMDFGAAGFRPAWSEGMPERMTWGCMMALPDSVAKAFADEYVSELAKYAPELACDQRAKAEAAARWNVFHVTVRVHDALLKDYQRGATRLRQQVLAWVRAFGHDSEDRRHYPALAQASRDCLERLRDQWDEADQTLPLWPAFVAA